MRLLLISNSTNAGEAYLEHPLEQIKSFLGGTMVNALFIPYAGVTISFDVYTSRVRKRFQEIGHDITSIHETEDPVRAVQHAQAIVVGGGNTFHLAKLMQDQGLMDPIRKEVLAGTPYIGWSAGSNMACPSIRTTNDMPIVEPGSFRALNLVPFQINPHYLDANPEGHAGETREMRIEEFIEANPGMFVVGLREGTMFLVQDGTIQLLGPKPARIFRKDHVPQELGPGSDFSFLL
ncbi:MAG: peptidase [Bacteroides sp. SM1_62]|nr:MAG: peptidase [Bacteroides sp. SM23_62]KPL24719.1 MAG: peptidase [Bacteroides sp. SM1_62]